MQHRSATMRKLSRDFKRTLRPSRATNASGFGRGYMGGCQNYGPFFGPYYNTAPNIQGNQKGAIIVGTTHIPSDCQDLVFCN